jgi:predicted Zn-dependent peptidase
MTTKITTLDNGLHVVTDTMREAESVVVGAWVGVGTRHEPWRANGVAHLVEHMMFKGTKKRSPYALSAAIEKNGGSMNAHTTREETAYYARVLPEDAGLATDIIADMLQHSAFHPKELDRERQVIVQEIGSYLDSPEEHVFDLMHELAYPKQTMGRPILGTAKTIMRLPRKAIIDYVKRYYHANAMVVAAAGRIEHKDFVALAKKHFGKLPRGRKATKAKAHIVGGVKMAPREIEQLHIILGFAGPSFYNRAIFPAQLLSLILGGSSSSRLFQKVREKRGLVYTINSGHSAFSDTGLFQVYAGTDPARVKELMPVIEEELRDVTKNIGEGELKRAKAQVRANMLMGQEDVMRRADVIGHQMLAFNRAIAIDEILRKLMAVTKEDVQALAKKLFAAHPTLTALGPVEGLAGWRKRFGEGR